MANVLQSIELPAADGLKDLRYLATLYLAALAFPCNQTKHNDFIGAVAAFRPGRRPPRDVGRFLARTQRIIYEQRLPAASVAKQVCMKLVAELTRGNRLQIEVPADATLTKTIRDTSDQRTIHKSPQNFMHHVWTPSKPVLHLGVALRIHGKLAALVDLIADPAWLRPAIKSAQFHRVLLLKSIEGLQLIQINQSDQSINAAAAAKLLPALTTNLAKN